MTLVWIILGAVGFIVISGIIASRAGGSGQPLDSSKG
ncbi:MAG: hypothetical protein UX61_C0005G0022 [Parcubacteria group bacterium GW2011_GWA2_46_7]|nr:MAG: hypothetical protein UX61_C0005G0022 [Parcubacteria group bacterium GW2011_GWA2_46_7]